MHVSGIPLSSKGRYGIYSPVEIYAQLGILKPFWVLKLLGNFYIHKETDMHFRA